MTTEEKDRIAEIRSTPIVLAEVTVKPSAAALLKNYDKSLAVIGYNFPTIYDSKESFLFVQILEIYRDRLTGVEVHSQTTSGISYGKSDMSDLRQKDNFNKSVISTYVNDKDEEITGALQVPRVLMYKQLLRSGEISIETMLLDVLKDYAEVNKETVL